MTRVGFVSSCAMGLTSPKKRTSADFRRFEFVFFFFLFFFCHLACESTCAAASGRPEHAATRFQQKLAQSAHSGATPVPGRQNANKREKRLQCGNEATPRKRRAETTLCDFVLLRCQNCRGKLGKGKGLLNGADRLRAHRQPAHGQRTVVSAARVGRLGGSVGARHFLGCWSASSS